MTKFTRIVLCSLIAVFAMPLEAHKAQNNSDGKKIKVEGLIISHVWVRAGKPNSAVYMTIINTTDKNRKIVSASAEGVAKKVELHDHLWDKNVMEMRSIDVIELPAKEMVKLRSGDKHIMLLDLKEPLQKGQIVAVKLKLDDNKEITVQGIVKPLKFRGYKKSMNKEECGCEKTAGKPCPCPKEKGASKEAEVKEKETKK